MSVSSTAFQFSHVVSKEFASISIFLFCEMRKILRSGFLDLGVGYLIFDFWNMDPSWERLTFD
jgi:hypothetical protein